MSSRSIGHRLILAARTVRHLEFRQASSYAAHAIRRRLMPWLGAVITPMVRGWADAAQTPDHHVLHRWAEGISGWLPFDEAKLQDAQAFADGHPRLLNQEMDFTAGFDWGYSKYGRLWEYHLHYLDIVVPLARSAAQGSPADLRRLEEITDSWRRGNPVGQNAGWEPYPTSIRLVNLMRAASLVSHEPALQTKLLEDVARQAGVLNACLETHLKANHLLTNLKALNLALAVLPDHRALRRKRLERLLLREIEQQFLSDGGHYERSPMYHALMTGDLVEMASVLRPDADASTLIATLETKAKEAIVFLEAMRHPDGGLSFFNDGNLEESYLSEGLRAFLSARGGHPDEQDSLQTFPESGYVVLRHGPWKMIWDCGPVGPDHQPGHAHADILSFELSYGMQRILTNSGVRGYADDETRSYARSTGAHNTVQIGESEQIELWASFRVGRRARPVLESARKSDAGYSLSGRYRWPTLPGTAIHRRTLQLDATGAIHVCDEMSGLGETPARAFYHVHPEVTLTETSDGIFLSVGGDRFQLQFESADVLVKESLYFPTFGTEMARPCIVLERVGDGPIQFHLSPSTPRSAPEHNSP